jgi:hypothetical protein
MNCWRLFFSFNLLYLAYPLAIQLSAYEYSENLTLWIVIVVGQFEHVKGRFDCLDNKNARTEKKNIIVMNPTKFQFESSE